MNILNGVLQHGSTVISISQLGNRDSDTINNLPKITQAVHKKERKKIHLLSLVGCSSLLTGETSWRRSVTPGAPLQPGLGFSVRKQANVSLSIWRVFALIKLLSLES